MSDFKTLKKQIQDLPNPYVKNYPVEHRVRDYARGFEKARMEILGLVDDFIMREEVRDDSLYV